MLNLHLERCKVKVLPIDATDVKQIINVGDVECFITKSNVIQYDGTEEKTLNQHCVTDVEWVSFENVLYMGNGTVFECYNFESETKTVIFIENGWNAVSWNTSQDRVAVANNNGVLRILILDPIVGVCTVLAVRDMKSKEKSSFINIGWGSANTQFSGTDKQRQLEEIPITQMEEFEELEDTNLEPIIKWRDDDEVFVVGLTMHGNRGFKIYSSELDFLYVNEHKPGLGRALAWKPDNIYLTTSQVLDGVTSILFYENNGLKWSAVPLGHNNAPVMNIEWSSTSDKMMVLQKSEKDDICEITVWGMCIDKWQLKQSLLFHKDHPVNNAYWVQNRDRLDVITQERAISYNWRWEPVVSYDNDDVKELGAIAIINGRDLHITLTSEATMPPPSHTFKETFEKPVNFVTFSTDGKSLLVILNNYMAYAYFVHMDELELIYELNLVNTTIEYFDTYRGVPLATNNFVYDFLKEKIYAIQTIPFESCVVQFTRSVGSDIVDKKIIYQTPDKVLSLLTTTEVHGLIIHTKKSVFIYKSESEATNLMEGEIEGKLCVKIFEGKPQIFSLNYNILSFNHTSITSNITSFLFCKDCLFLTSDDDILVGLKCTEKSLKCLKKNDMEYIYTRKIAKGSTLVRSVPGTRKLIFFIPNGETEIINPRILSLQDIDVLLEKKRHLEALEIMRSDRIDMNIYYDLNPNRFMENIVEIVKDLGRNNLDKFISSIKNKNVAKELYTNCFEDPLPNPESSNKIEVVLDKLIETMAGLNHDYYLIHIITAHIYKKTEKDMEQVLEELHEGVTLVEEYDVVMPVPLETILDHAIKLTSAEILYNTALGMQRFEILTWISTKTQKDPLEFIPFLEELGSMETHYRDYKINYHVKRYEKAFICLIQSKNNILEELLDLIKSHDLYKLILKHVVASNKWHKPLVLCLGHYLEEKGCRNEAGIMFQRIGEYKQALKMYLHCADMHQVLNMTYILKLDESNKQLVYLDLIMKLISNDKYRDASYISENYLHKYEEAIHLLLRGKFWSEAINMAYKYDRFDIVHTDIKTTLQTYVNDLLILIYSNKTEFDMYKLRLEVVRKRKIEIILNQHNMLAEPFSLEQGPICTDGGVRMGVMSVAASIRTATTQLSQVSTASSSAKRRRKLERKLTQIREGSTYENIALVRHLHQITTDMLGYSETIGEISYHLLAYSDCYNLISNLHLKYGELLDLLKKASVQIWTKDFLHVPEPISLTSIVLRENIDFLEYKYRTPPNFSIKDWKPFCLH